MESLPQVYLDLVERTRQLDPNAAQYLMYEAQHLDSFRPKDNLNDCFTWSATPQGDDYWEHLYYQVPKASKIRSRREIFTQHYLELIEAVRKIDLQAAEYMENDAHKLHSFRTGRRLRNVFDWPATPQGSHFWEKITKTLKDRGYH